MYYRTNDDTIQLINVEEADDSMPNVYASPYVSSDMQSSSGSTAESDMQHTAHKTLATNTIIIGVVNGRGSA